MFLADRAGPAGQAAEVYFPSCPGGRSGVDRPRPEKPGETMPLPDGTPTLEVRHQVDGRPFMSRVGAGLDVVVQGLGIVVCLGGSTG